jgi:hypothetical protein
MRIRPASVGDLARLLASGSRPKLGYVGVLVRPDEGSLRQSRVWHLGDLARIEEPPGRLSVVAGEQSFWYTVPGEPDLTELPRTPESRYRFVESIMQRDPLAYWSDWLGADPDLVMESLTAVTYHRRPGWRFTAPAVKGGTPEITVDADLGVVVHSQRPDVGLIREWIQLRPDPSLTPAFFRPQRHD